MKNLFEKIENIQISIFEWMAGLTCILFVRFFLESFSAPNTSGIIQSDAETIVSYSLFYIVATIGLMLLFQIFTKKGLKLVTVSLSLMFFLWLAPIIDLVISGGQGFARPYTFMFGGLKSLFFNFLTFFGSNSVSGVSIGMRIELALVIIVAGFYVFRSSGSKIKSFLFMVVLYCFIFFTGVIPSVLYVISAGGASFNASGIDVINFIDKSITSSALVHNTLHGTLSYASYARFFELTFDKLMSQVLFLMSVLAASVWFWKIYPEKFKAVLRNSRFGRVFHYLSLVLMGALFAFTGGYGILTSWVDILSLVCLLVSWYAVWMFAVHVNDVYDQDTDALSNPARPLTSGLFSISEMKRTAVLWLTVALFGSFAVGYYQFFMCLVFAALSYVYSAPPFRLKQVTMLSSFIIGLASLTSVLAGFFFVSFDKVLHVFSPLIAIGIVLMFTLLTNVRDLKDIEGDSAAGVNTLPVVFGPTKGRTVVASLFALSFLIVPLFTFLPLIFIALPTAALAYYLVATKKKEKTFFILYFSFVILSGLFIVFY